MPGTRRRPPRYLRKNDGSAYTYVYQSGRRRQIHLGPWGSPESTRRFREIVAGFDASASRDGDGKRVAAPTAPPIDVSVALLCARFLEHRDGYYRDAAGEATGETANYERAIRFLYHVGRVERFWLRVFLGIRSANATNPTSLRDLRPCNTTRHRRWRKTERMLDRRSIRRGDPPEKGPAGRRGQQFGSAMLCDFSLPPRRSVAAAEWPRPDPAPLSPGQG